MKLELSHGLQQLRAWDGADWEFFGGVLLVGLILVLVVEFFKRP